MEGLVELRKLDESAGWRERQWTLSWVFSPEHWTESHKAGEGVAPQSESWWGTSIETVRYDLLRWCVQSADSPIPSLTGNCRFMLSQNKRAQAQGQDIEQTLKKGANLKTRLSKGLHFEWCGYWPLLLLHIHGKIGRCLFVCLFWLRGSRGWKALQWVVGWGFQYETQWFSINHSQGQASQLESSFPLHRASIQSSNASFLKMNKISG